ncbi:WecB/TagA/CpsF family glycosyltransferase [bacterium]|nr:WecB/TagA/CpsF family glycosyltransferase [bacterium]
METNKWESRSLFGVNYSIVDYNYCSDIVIEKAINRVSFGLSALAVHGLIESILQPEIYRQLKKIDMIVPDGHPVRWALNSFYKIALKDRVHGPILTFEILKKADRYGLGIYLFGSTQRTVNLFAEFITEKFPNIRICGVQADRFREATDTEDMEDIKRINNSQAHIILVGRGCPRQEVWVGNHLDKIQAPLLAVGSAFDIHAGVLKAPPEWIQKSGFHWLYRLCQEPRRLWKRYLITNTCFIYLFLKHKFILRKPF